MGAEKERRQLKRQYFSESWTKKVNSMTDAQVIAIYLRFKAQGRFS